MIDKKLTEKTDKEILEEVSRMSINLSTDKKEETIITLNGKKYKLMEE